jgi:hypothetical protein
MLLCCLRRTLKPSASTIVISKLFQHFRGRGSPYGLQDSLPTLNPSCSLYCYNSAMGPRLDMGGWLTLTEKHYCSPSQQGLSPCKMHRALLGAITWNSPATAVRSPKLNLVWTIFCRFVSYDRELKVVRWNVWLCI